MVFFNERSADGEHSHGYTVQLWQYNGSFIGTVSYNQGLIGDHVDEAIANVTYNKVSGDLSFSSSLDGQKINFKGKVNPTRLTGTFSWKNRMDKSQALTSCCKDAFIYKSYRSYKDWENRMKEFE